MNNEVHTGKLIDVRRQSRTGHQGGFCNYTYVWSIRGEKVFQMSTTDLGLNIGDESLLHVEWPQIAKPCVSPLWMWS